ncbi:MAG: UDP-N-acetylmuramoyl-tripeptide--D-alanyl-D-alanine ligase [Betaproteobacteria bacterium]|nr:UDP-N-acetylmuramoyl-tripeptide--D-alanyl-D-alanine ligase [Betaproteobacteria bacterium]
MMSLAEAAGAMGARLANDGAGACDELRLRGVSTDTRSIGKDQLFVAIRGEHYDGHDFLAMAQERGAVAALVDESYVGKAPLPLLVADDTRRALGRLGRNWRLRFAPVVIAIAGSNGKTTTKEMLASILRRHAGEGGALATRGNLNTDIGVPLTLLELRASHRYCAIELGMNHPGEIAQLADIARPTVALVNNAQREHLEFMQSVEAVAAENASVFDALPDDGIAVLNAEDAMAGVFREKAGRRRRIEFGITAGEVTCRYVLKALASEIVLNTPSGKARVTLAIPGLHNVRNALAAAASSHAAGIPADVIGAGLAAFQPYAGRLQVKKTSAGATLLDDSYNANPDSVRAAIDVLASCQGPTALVLGDMGEVGEQGPEFHAEMGRYARERGVSVLLALGTATPAAVKAFGDGGRHFDEIEKLVAATKGVTTILVKGSRFMKMERVVAVLAGEMRGPTEATH